MSKSQGASVVWGLGLGAVGEDTTELRAPRVLVDCRVGAERLCHLRPSWQDWPVTQAVHTECFVIFLYWLLPGP